MMSSRDSWVSIRVSRKEVVRNMGSLLTSRQNAGEPRARIWKAGGVGDGVRLGGEQSSKGHMTGSEE